MNNNPKIIRKALCLLLGSSILLSGCGNQSLSNNKTAATDKNTTTKSTLHKSASSNQQNQNDNKDQPINWLLPTGGAYPAIGPNDNIWIKVSKADQKVYIMNGNKTIYTMISSTGLDTSPDTSTPEGTFHIQQERGTSFYNASEKEGAKYWVSWKNHGEFLFHSVATDKNGNVIPSEAMKLGQKASHGCVRLAMPDAKWIYDNIKYNTKVVIS
jgi:lipoprotein-anchoring transpeptidase ErfK/SrfK